MRRNRTAGSWTGTGGGISLCATPGVLSSGNAPIHTDLLGGLPGGGETFGLLAVLGVLAVAGRWAYHRLGGQPLGATAHADVEVVADSNELWDEFDRQREPTEA